MTILGLIYLTIKRIQKKEPNREMELKEKITPGELAKLAQDLSANLIVLKEADTKATIQECEEKLDNILYKIQNIIIYKDFEQSNEDLEAWNWLTKNNKNITRK